MNTIPCWATNSLYQPHSPTMAKEPVVEYGYIDPNQFTSITDADLSDALIFDKRVDERYEEDEAKKVAKALSAQYGVSVVVSYYDEWDEVICKQTVKA